MEIKLVESQPYEKSVVPSIKFDVKIEHKKCQESIIGVNGWIESKNGKIITEISEIAVEDLKISHIMAKNSDYDPRFENGIYEVSFLSLLNEKSLEYIEKRRIETNGDVELNLRLRVRFIRSNATLFHSKLVDPSELDINISNLSDKDEIVAYTYDSSFSPRKDDCWVISGKGSPVFLSVVERELKKDIRIPSSDWIRDYSPKLGIGEYFIVEIPKGKKELQRAWDYMNKAENSYMHWDTKGTYANCREIGNYLNEIIYKEFEGSPIIKKWKRANVKLEYRNSLDLHLEEIKNEIPKGDIEINKAEAEYVLIMTKALIKYAEELLNEKEL